jgi:serine/threonine protein kinase
VAVKVIKTVRETSDEAMQRVSDQWQAVRFLISVQKLRRERKLWGELDHPNICPFYGYATDQEIFKKGLGALISPVIWHFILSFYLTMLQWYEHGDASQFLKAQGESMDILARSTVVNTPVSSGHQR